ncbi:unnamed protein product [Ambrosiozyma monospora]|uniref:Unnamed protein product n=1 Tax=Ambrosiozyma monospora TaxID=43982 RepID=A0A9W6Z7B3_AMBMO|nr:unnamed protein product [Ambrosiozyma monospora]
MEKELSIIDAIVVNLVATRQYYEFQYQHLSTLIGLLSGFKSEKQQELKDDTDIFKKESEKDLKYFTDKLSDLKNKIQVLGEDIDKRVATRQKLVGLFESLKMVNDLDSGNKKNVNTDGQSSSNPSSKPDTTSDNLQLPLMEIREELDENDNIVSSKVSPYDPNHLADSLTTSSKQL